MGKEEKQLYLNQKRRNSREILNWVRLIIAPNKSVCNLIRHHRTVQLVPPSARRVNAFDRVRFGFAALPARRPRRRRPIVQREFPISISSRK